MSSVFSIFPSPKDLVAEENLELVKCYCGGDLKKELKDDDVYGKCYTLTCNKCGGKYAAVETSVLPPKETT